MIVNSAILFSCTRARSLERHGTLLQSADVDVDLFDRRRLVVAPGFRPRQPRR
jgi:hypothetical protein